MIEIVRAPLLGNRPSMLTLEVLVLITMLNLMLAVVIFSRYRSRIAYWV
jgi:ABC-2 type transport system permease protein/lipopolysaccharide transport system permease protein